MDKWENFYLNKSILNNLQDLEFYEPTSIQEKVLVYLKAETDLIIQARTGEGKTLCYGLPIINYLLNLYENTTETNKTVSPVALILVPTRELGIQVRNHLMQIIFDKDEKDPNKKDKIGTYHNIKIVNILGGFAKEKQLKILNKYSPEIIIATPGRLWEILDNNEASIVSTLHNIQYLVLDEADRMMEKGHFRELKLILSLIYNRKDNFGKGIKKKSKKENYFSKIRQISNKSEMENEKIKEMLKQKNVSIDDEEIEEFDPLDMFNDLGEDQLKFEKNLKKIENYEDNDEDQDIERDNEEDEIQNEDEIENEDVQEDDADQFTEEGEKQLIEEEEEEQEEEEDEEEEEEEEVEDKIETKKRMQVNIRTFLCSATIEKVDFNKMNEKKKKGNKKVQENEEKKDKVKLESLIKFVHFYNKLIFVKLSNEEHNGNENNEEEKNKTNILPERLELEAFKCESLLKDYYLYHILNNNPNKSIIIFTNSISHTKKLKSILSMLDFKLCALHSKMLQSQRIKNLERFSHSKDKQSTTQKFNILICTDVGARGLDIPYVDLVIHYHIPKTIELFVHRSGRTARAHKEGKCLSLVSENEINFFNKIMNSLRKDIPLKSLPISDIEKYKNLFDLSKKFENEDYKIKKKTRETQWFEKKAQECDIELDDLNKNFVVNNKPKDSMLLKKRKQVKTASINQKKIFQNILSTNIPRTSFLSPYLVHKLNSVLSTNTNLKNVNLSEMLRSAKEDSKTVKLKPVKKKYIHRRKNKKIRH